MVITSAGCNALDYLLAGCGEVNAVDVNPIQNALLEFKTAACRTLDYDSFFSLFGKGRSPYARQMYFDSIRPLLSAPARATGTSTSASSSARAGASRSTFAAPPGCWPSWS